MAGSVLNSTAVLRLNFCAKLNICASISATSPSRKTLAEMAKKLTEQNNIGNFAENLIIIKMNKKTTILATILFASASLFAQDVKKENETVKTKMDLFSSKTGTITKFVDTNLPNLKTAYGGAETKIRKIINGVNSAYFFQITNKGKYGSSTASIEYSDLIEVLKALKALQPEVEKDIATNPNYLENKFVTVDGFQVGYYVSGGKAVWYLKLEKYGSDNTLFIDNGTTIETAFSEAKNKIDELKK